MQIVDFLRDNWQYIAVAIITVFEVLILIVKRLKVQLVIPPNSYRFVIDTIKSAEDIFGEGHGKQKLDYVVDAYVKHFDVNKIFVPGISSYIESVIESILETPTKKGGCGREEVK